MRAQEGYYSTWFVCVSVIYHYWNAVILGSYMVISMWLHALYQLDLSLQVLQVSDTMKGGILT